MEWEHSKQQTTYNLYKYIYQRLHALWRKESALKIFCRKTLSTNFDVNGISASSSHKQCYIFVLYNLLKAKPSNVVSLCRLFAVKTISNKLHDITFFKEVFPLHTVYCFARKFEIKLDFIIFCILIHDTNISFIVLFSKSKPSSFQYPVEVFTEFLIINYEDNGFYLVDLEVVENIISIMFLFFIISLIKHWWEPEVSLWESQRPRELS